MFTIESLKQFLKLDWRKILLMILFLIFSSFIVYSGTDCQMEGGGCTENYGLPFTVSSVHHYVIDVLHNQPDHPTAALSINYLFLMPNLIFWYLISCLLISAWDKIKNKNK